MANPEHLEILKQDLEKWNEWRKENSHIRPDPSHANLSRAYLNIANLNSVDLIMPT